MAVNWKDALWKSANEIMRKGGKLELIVYKRDMKRKPVIHLYPDSEISCDEETLID